MAKTSSLTQEEFNNIARRIGLNAQAVINIVGVRDQFINMTGHDLDELCRRTNDAHKGAVALRKDYDDE